MAERRGAAPAGPRQSDDALQKTRQQTRLFSPRKRPKTMQNDLRSSFLAPFRADRATAASDIIHHVADDDLRRVRQQRLVRCRSMCGPRFSPGRGFGQKSRRGSRDLAGAFPASTVCTRWASRAVLSAAGPRTGPRGQPLGIEGSCATRAFTTPIFRFSPRGASRGYEPWPLEPMAAAATSRTSKPQNDGISIIRAGRGSERGG